MSKRYRILDLHTCEEVGEAATRNGARRSADRRNIAYGAHRYRVRDTETGYSI